MSTGEMQLGDFTTLAAEYENRAAYSLTALTVILNTVRTAFRVPTFADVGAGTGKLTNNLIELGLSGVAVEPNDAMRAVGIEKCTAPDRAQWREGKGEATGLPNASAEWLLMASSFHWTDPSQSLPEFHRVLRPGGYLTVLWNPRDLECSALHQQIEARIHEIAPDIKRVSSGSSRYTQGIEDTLVSTGHFQDVFFVECRHEERMTPQRYLGAWRSVNDIQAQAGPERWAKILDAIAGEIAGLDEIIVPYKTRAWTARAKR